MTTTLEGIVESLRKLSDDKKKQITVRYNQPFNTELANVIPKLPYFRYDQNSIWLANELEVLMKLINQNPRDNKEASVSSTSCTQQIYIKPSNADENTVGIKLNVIFIFCNCCSAK